MEQIIEHYADGYARLKEALEGVSDELLHYKPAPGKWSVKQIIIHVADAEMVAVDRMKRVIAENNPLLFKFDPDAWADRLGYDQLDHLHYLAQFKLLRAGMEHVLRSLKPDDWKRTGVHNVSGKQTLEDIVRMFAKHVDAHIDQINRNKQAFAQK